MKMDFHKGGARLEVCDITFAYPGYREVFSNVSFSLMSGQILCILGPNGAGKTTLLNCLANLVPPGTGQILIDGRPMDKMQPREIAQKIGYVPQLIEPSFAFAVLDYVVTGCAPYMSTFKRPCSEHYDIAYQSLQKMEIEHLAERSYMHISGGERQQVAISRALAQRPAFILMDEPIAHLDCGNQVNVLETVREMADEGYGIVLTTHNPDHALLLGGKAAIIDRCGRLRFGQSEEILTQDTLSELYGTKLNLFYSEVLSRTVCAAPSLDR